MGVANYLDIFQQKMNDLIHGFEFIHAYKYELLILKKVNWADHIQNLESTVNKLKEKGLKCDIEKKLFGQTDMGYLGVWVTRDVSKPINRNI